MLTLLARQWCATPEDVVQEAFLKLSQVKPVPDQPAAWLFRVVRNAAISAGRAEQRRDKHEQRCQEQQAEWFTHDSAAAIDAEQAKLNLQELPVAEREAIIGHVWGELTFEALGVGLGVSASTAHRLYMQALQKLRLAMGAHHE